MVFRYISSKLKQINSHILFGALWLMHLLLSGQELAKRKKTNEQKDDNKEIIRFFYQIALVIFFPIWKRRAHFVFEAFRIQVAAQSKLKKNKKQKQTNKTKNKRGNKLYRILRSFFQVTMLTFLLIKILIKGYSSYR